MESFIDLTLLRRMDVLAGSLSIGAHDPHEERLALLQNRTKPARAVWPEASQVGPLRGLLVSASHWNSDSIYSKYFLGSHKP